MRILAGVSDPAIVTALARHTVEVETRASELVRRAQELDLVLVSDASVASRIPPPVIVVTKVGDVEARVLPCEGPRAFRRRSDA